MLKKNWKVMSSQGYNLSGCSRTQNPKGQSSFRSNCAVCSTQEQSAAMNENIFGFRRMYPTKNKTDRQSRSPDCNASSKSIQVGWMEILPEFLWNFISKEYQCSMACNILIDNVLCYFFIDDASFASQLFLFFSKIPDRFGNFS